MVPKAALEPSPARRTAGERERRDTERLLYQELSRYYTLDKYVSWARPTLLAKCKHGRRECAGDIPLTRSLPVVDELEARHRPEPQND